ncbi:MAG: hypothetical protein IKZ19_06465, partial [Clostridia bacterium]|nr:hypothetical protein [Clostridia bacterium]
FCVAFIGSLLYSFLLSIIMPVCQISAINYPVYGLEHLLEIGRPVVYLLGVILCQALSAAFFTGFTFLFSLFIREKYTVMVLPFLTYEISLLAESFLGLNLIYRYCVWVPEAYSPMGVIGKKLIFVFISLLLVCIAVVRKAERDVLNG